MIIPVGPQGAQQFLMQIDRLPDGQWMQSKISGTQLVYGATYKFSTNLILLLHRCTIRALDYRRETMGQDPETLNRYLKFEIWLF